MTKEEMGKLGRGDLVRHKTCEAAIVVVMDNYGDRVTAVQTVDITNENEWDLIKKANYG
jgi:hypothetical protein